MSWAIGYDRNWKRDVGYGVPAKCDHPDCDAQIHRGMAYVCGNDVYGGEHGCGLFFCETHQTFAYTPEGYELLDDAGNDLPWMCERCVERHEHPDREVDPFDAKPDVPEWINWKLTDESWQEWRSENPAEVIALRVLADRDAKHPMYPIATICGSMKLSEDIRTMAEVMTRHGYLVLLPNVSKNGSRLNKPTPITDDELDRMHRAKIGMADLVVFVTQERQYVWGQINLTHDEVKTLYFSESTTAELKYARSLGKPIGVARMRRRDYRDTVIWIDPIEVSL